MHNNYKFIMIQNDTTKTIKTNIPRNTYGSLMTNRSELLINSRCDSSSSSKFDISSDSKFLSTNC